MIINIMSSKLFQAGKYKVITISILAAGVFFVLGLYLGFKIDSKQASPPEFLINTEADISSQVDFAPFWKVWQVLDEKFVPTKVSTSAPVSAAATSTVQDRVWGAIEGLTGSLGDPYTVFF